jgi:hypothetical protein
MTVFLDCGSCGFLFSFLVTYHLNQSILLLYELQRQWRLVDFLSVDLKHNYESYQFCYLNDKTLMLNG